MRSTDVATLFGPAAAGPALPVTYRQGTIITFNKLTLENTVSVGGATLTNLPILGVGETTSLEAGDPVGILAMGNVMAILGQMVIPGTAAAGEAISLASANTYSVTTPAFETRSSSAWGNLATVGPVVEDVRIGPSGRCLVWITSTLILLGTSGGAEMSYEISGATTVPVSDTPPALAYYGPAGSGPTATRLVLQENLNPGLHTFTAKYSAVDFGPGGSARFGGRNLTVMAL
jgi:hypothetical protein